MLGMKDIDLNLYPLSAVLLTIKKQQIFANWGIIESKESFVKVGFSSKKVELNVDELENRFLQQLSDEIIRVELEKEFSSVRKMLVEKAFQAISEADAGK